jgi:hypothetical protein
VGTEVNEEAKMSDPTKLNPFSAGTSSDLPQEAPVEEPSEEKPDLQPLRDLAGLADPALSALKLARLGVDTTDPKGAAFVAAMLKPATVETSEDVEYLKQKAQLADHALRQASLIESGVNFAHPAGKLFLRMLERSEAWKTTIPSPDDIRHTADLNGVPIREGYER